jgi:hypothetical protein
MLVNKITNGFVIQVFDTELKRFASQEFVAGEDCQYEDKDGVSVCSEALEVDGKEAYLPFDMVQPKDGNERKEDVSPDDEELPFGGSHAPDCPYHAGGECLCWRSDPQQNPELSE